MRLARFFRTPKGIAIIALAILAVPAALGSGVGLVAPLVVGATVASMAIDAPILRIRNREWTFPDGALLTGLFVAMILSPHESWWVGALTGAVAIVSKYALRVRNANLFNPAALALVVTFYAFGTGQSWWGALPELPPAALVLLFATGIYVSRRLNKMAAVLSFLGCYYGLITVTAFVGNPAGVAELYRAPDLHAALFFAFFMVTDPPTSPPKARDQVTFGAITALASLVAFEALGAVYYLLAGVLAANLWEGWRKWRLGRRRGKAEPSASLRMTTKAPS
ncbi:MAG: RnfABCDGE type electron transport complex subunit D [Gemmatimonadaceae bacterium]